MGEERTEPSGASLSYRNILERELEDALREIERPSMGLFLSGLSAGLNLSFGALFMGMVLTFSTSFPSPLARQSLLAAVSSVAFLFVILGQTELFTAHATLAVLPVLDGRARVRELGRLWAVIYAGNLLGCVLFACLIAVLGPELGIASASSFASLAGALLGYPWWTIVLSGVVAGWLMGLVVWLVAASRDTVGRILVVLLGTSAIGFGPFHHAILGTTEILGAILLGADVTLGQFAGFLLWTTIGNVIGGVVFVAGLNYGHISLSEGETEVDDELKQNERTDR